MEFVLGYSFYSCIVRINIAYLYVVQIIYFYPDNWDTTLVFYSFSDYFLIHALYILYSVLFKSLQVLFLKFKPC